VRKKRDSFEDFIVALMGEIMAFRYDVEKDVRLPCVADDIRKCSTQAYIHTPSQPL
jgi:hypothetical protein